MEYALRKYKRWKFKNTFLLVLSILFVFYLADTETFRIFIEWIGSMGLFGAFIIGFFFVSTFTVVPSSIVLLSLAKQLDPIQMSLVAGAGSMIGDFIIFRFLKDKVFKELKPVFHNLGRSHISKLFSTPFFGWLAPFIGALIIISPFPDELGIGLMGISKLKNWQFLILSYILDSFGIWLIITVARFI